MGTGFQQEFKSAIDEPMREMRETADMLKKSADFTSPDFTSAAPKPATDTVADRPKRNESVAPADPDAVPTADVPFADDDAVSVDELADPPDEPADRGEADDA
jgi:sec-independent protein translocase protein TatB